MTYSMSDQIKVGEISPFFITWIFINKNCFMKQIFEILQEERDRILDMHESATKNQYLGEQTMGPFNSGNYQLDSAVKNLPNQPKPKPKTKTEKYLWNLIQSAGQGQIKNSGVFKTVQVKNKIGNKVRGSFVDKSNYSSNFVADCAKPYVITLDGSSLQGTTLQVSSNLKDQISKMCGSKKEVEVKGGTESTPTNGNAHVLESNHYLYSGDNMKKYILPAKKTLTFNPEKNGASLKAYTLDENGKPTVGYNGWFNCQTGKFTVKSESGKFLYYSDKPFVGFLQKKCERLKKESNSGDSSNAGTDSAGLGNSTGGTTVTKPNDTALDTILQKISGSATQKPGEVKQVPQTWEG